VTVSSLVLSDPARGITSQLVPRQGVAFQGLSAAGTVRAVVESRQGGHGTRDSTRSFDDAAVSLQLRFYSGTRALLDEVGSFLHPAARFFMVVSDTEWPAGPRQLYLRYDSGNSPIELGKGLVRDVQYSWRGPHGVWEAAVPVSTALPAIIEDDNGGLTVTTSGLTTTNVGLTVAAGSSPSSSLVQSAGNVEADWQAILYGPATGPKLGNDTAGRTLEFTDNLVLSATDFVLLDSASQSALLNGDPGGSVLGLLNFPTSDWWLMQPGLNQVRYYPTVAGSSSTQAQLTFSPAWACA
jgi:hypothetical protein